MSGSISPRYFPQVQLVQGSLEAWLQELYGGRTAGDLLSSLSRLWTIFLQGSGFTCGIGDLLLTPAAERKRAELTAQAERKATCASAEIVGISTDDLQDVNDSNVRPCHLQSHRILVMCKNLTWVFNKRSSPDQSMSPQMRIFSQ